jgi:cystathionine beta-lyase/cystathionine gamma-synthase
MTALDIILRLIQPGDVVLAGTDIYGGTDRLLTFLKTQGGAEVRHLDLDVRDDLEAVLQDVGKRCKMVLVESPTNPLLKIADLRMISSLVHAASPEALVVVDNTMMSPYLQRPYQVPLWASRRHGRDHRRRTRRGG